jgi:hypothetical protein
VSIILATLLAVGGADDHSVIPPTFHGTWHVDVLECDPGLDSQVLMIAERALLFYEWTGEVTRVTLVDPKEILVDANMNEHDETWNAKYRFQLSSDLGTLTEKQEGSPQIIRHRCSDERQNAPNN